MLKTYIVLFVIIFAVFLQPLYAIDIHDSTIPLTSIENTRDVSSLPLSFTANNGQWDNQIKFRANSGGAILWFSSDGAYSQFNRVIEPEQNIDEHLMPDQERELKNIETMMIKTSFVGSNQNARVVGLDEIEYKCNYFLGNDPTNWQIDVPNYQAVIYKGIYEGIDLKYYGNDRQMEYDLIIAPGADYRKIEIEYEGAESISVNKEGQLVVKTKWNEVIEKRPIIYQENDNKRIPIYGEYKITDNNKFSFELDDYDISLPVVIDPVLEYSTYLGGSDLEIGLGIEVDASGMAYVVGWTSSVDFPTLNQYQDTLNNSPDVFVTKMNSSGNGLIYSTYLGGSNNDYGISIALDSSGSVYITGQTESDDFPTVNSYQSVHKYDRDAFVVKLNNSGNDLIYSTYLGDNGYDVGRDIAVDNSGAAYITGRTSSSYFPTLNAYHDMKWGEWDAFVTKLNSSGNSLIYSTYLGGSEVYNNYFPEYAEGIIVDDLGFAYVTGRTNASNFPLVNPLQSSMMGVEDAFVSKLNSTGDSLVFSTYLGGDGADFGYDLGIDKSGSVYVTGYTESSDFPVKNPYNESLQGSRDAFVSKISSAGDSLIYSTYFGGGDIDDATDIEVDKYGLAYIVGTTSSLDLPTLDYYQDVLRGVDDAFVAKLNNLGNGLVYSTYIGGDSTEIGYNLAIDAIGSVFITGNTHSDNFPTLNPVQDTLSGSFDAIVLKFQKGNDSDGDGLDDNEDNCPFYFNPLQGDSDSDNVGDSCDLCEGFPDSIDTDDDNIPDSCDVCEGYDDNSDTDSDGIPDGCDLCTDTDNDGFGDPGHPGNTCPEDQCEGFDDNVDTDMDGIPDGCDICEGYDDNVDNDFDGIPDGCDQCEGFDDNIDSNENSIPDSCEICGDINLDGTVDISDLIEFNDIFIGTTPIPQLFGVADLDSCSGIDISDITYFVDYYLTSGPPPHCDVDTCVETVGGSISLSSVDGLNSAGKLKLGEPITFTIHATNDSTQSLGIANGFRIYSEDGIIWDSLTVDTIYPGWGDLWAFQTTIFEVNVDGHGADTVGFYSTNFAYGLSPLFDEDIYTISIGPITNYISGSICIDSSWFPNFGTWKWANDNKIPSWGGPYCFELDCDSTDSDNDGVGDACDICEGYDDNIDTDADGVPDGCDACEGFDDNIDTDADGIPDSCDICYGFNDNLDFDLDSIPDGCDNCPSIINPDQIDTNNDNIGDACTFTTPTDSGTDVDIDLGNDIGVTFDTVNTGGETELTETINGPEESSSFTIIPDDSPIYYNISTTADYSGGVKVCIEYDDTLLTAVQEALLTLQHYDGITWENITVSLDTLENIICGLTYSFSSFAIAVLNSCCINPTGDINNDGGANPDISDLLYLVDYSFVVGSPEIMCPEEADVDGSGAIDVSDLLYLVDYMFLVPPGPAPVDCP